MIIITFIREQYSNEELAVKQNFNDLTTKIFIQEFSNTFFKTLAALESEPNRWNYTMA